MADDIEKDFDASAIREAIYGDAFSSSTNRVGRSLLLLATMVLITAVFDVTLKSTPLVPLDFSEQPDGLIIFLAVVNLALLINYALRASNDFLKAGEDWDAAKRLIGIERVMRARRTAQFTEDEVMSADPGGDPGQIVDPWWEDYADTREEAVRR